MDCTKIKEDEVENPLYTDGQYLSIELMRTRRNSRLQFLILLRDVDYKKCIFSFRDILWYKKNHFPGDLILENFDDCHQLPYFIEEPILPRQLYVMLPKEKMFVPSDVFTEMYIRSKMRELLHIFTKLNAKVVKFTRYNSESELSNIALDASLSFPNGNVQEVAKVINEDKSLIGTEYVMRFKENQEPFSIKDFLNVDSYHYLRQEPDWQYIIKRRVDYGMTYHKYSYTNNERKLLKRKFVSKMKVLDLGAEYDWEKYKELTIDYEIEFYPALSKVSKDKCV